MEYPFTLKFLTPEKQHFNIPVNSTDSPGESAPVDVRVTVVKSPLSSVVAVAPHALVNLLDFGKSKLKV